MDPNAAMETARIKSESAKEPESPPEDPPAKRRAIEPTAMAKSKESESKAKEREDKRNTEQPKLVLSSSSRDQLFASLSEVSAVIQCNQSLADVVKQRTHEKIKESVQLLMDLPPFEPTSSANESTENPPSPVVESVDLRSDSEEPLSVQSDAESNLNEELAKLHAITRSQAEQIANLEGKVKALKRELKRELKNVNIARPEASHKFQLAGVSNFFELGTNEVQSEAFQCRKLSWSLVVKSTLSPNGQRFLSLFLNCHHDSPHISWECKLTYKLILFSRLPEMPNLVRRFKFSFGRLTGTSFGLFDFISYRELTEEKNGYIMDDKIVLGVELEPRVFSAI